MGVEHFLLELFNMNNYKQYIDYMECISLDYVWVDI